jgi:hypothetical protein
MREVEFVKELQTSRSWVYFAIQKSSSSENTSQEVCLLSFCCEAAFHCPLSSVLLPLKIQQDAQWRWRSIITGTKLGMSPSRRWDMKSHIEEL